MVEVSSAKKDEFIKKYGDITGDNPVEKQGFFVIKSKKRNWGQDYRIFFDPKETWVVNSFKRLGYESSPVGKSCPYDEIALPSLISSEELFWWLVEYGYRIGDNEPISFDDYEKKII